MEWKPKRLCFPAGNMSLTSILRIVSLADRKGILDKVRSYSGSGNGVLVATLIAMKCLEYSKELNNHFVDSHTQIFSQKNGSEQSKFIEEYFGSLFLSLYGTIPTMFGFYLLTGKSLSFSCYNFTEKKSVIFSDVLTPKMNLLVAMRLACNLPYINFDISFEGNTYWDGAASNPVPIDSFRVKSKILIIHANRRLPSILQSDKNSKTYGELTVTILFDALCSSSLTQCQGRSLYLNIPSSESTFTNSTEEECKQVFRTMNITRELCNTCSI